MRHTLISLLSCGCLFLWLTGQAPGQVPDAPHTELNDFNREGPLSWSEWAPRRELQPICSVDATQTRSAHPSLAISGAGNPAEFGGWSYPIHGIREGRFYRLTAFFKTDSVPDEARQVVARLDWLNAAGSRVGQPDYAFVTSRQGDWTRLTLSVPAPPGASAVKLQLCLGWAPQGTVWWNDLSFQEDTPPKPRRVRLGTICLHPHNEPDNLGAYLRSLDAIAADKPDIVCLGEELLVEGNSRTYLSAAEEIPGPSTRLLGEKARRYGMYIVAGLTEKAGPLVYNTAVLIDRPVSYTHLTLPTIYSV